MNLKLIFLLIGTCMMLSCTKNFEEINTDPNNPSIVEPDFLFTSSILSTMNLYGGNMNREIFFNYTQQYSGFQGEFQRYTYSNASNNTYWRNTYINCLQPVHQIELKYKDDPAYRNRVTIAGIWKNFIYSNAVSIWGGIPTTAALDGDPAVRYEKEQDVYYRLLDDLKQLASDLDLDGDRFSSESDKIYQGDIQKWRKFANTLRLRIAMRISNTEPNGDPETSRKVVAEILQDEAGTITAQEETAAARWGLTSDTWSPLYDRVVYNYTANAATIPVLCESMVYFTLPYGDPRLAIYGQPAAQGPQKGEFFGQNISYGGGSEFSDGRVNPHTGLKQADYSQIGTLFLKPDAEYVFLSYAESCFLKAEATLKGWLAETPPETYYYEGIDASFNRYGLTSQEATTYKDTPGIKWNTASDTVGRGAAFQDWLQICSSYVGATDNSKRIVMQHWLAIPLQGVDAWSLLRRTQLLELEPQFATYDGNYAYMPQRILYPTDEYQTNAAEVQKAVTWLDGEDNLFTKLWFALPTRKNPYLPY